MKFAHMSDSHIGIRQYNLDQREQDFYDAFHQTIDKIIEERVDFVIHSGDLFEHSRPPIRALIEAKKGFLRLKERNIPVYIVPGNHEMPRRRGNLPPVLLYEGMIKTISRDDKFFEENGVFIGGFPYYSSIYSDLIKEELSHLEKKASGYKKRVLVMHQGIRKYISFEGSYELEIGDLPDNFHYYAAGHIHKRIIDEYGEGLLAYPGATEMWRIDEYDDAITKGKGFYLVDLGGDMPNVEPITIKTREFIKKDVKIEALDNAIQMILTLAKNKPIIWLRISGKNYDASSIAEKVYIAFEKVALHVKPDIRIEDEPIPIDPDGDGINIERILREYMAEKYNEDEIEFACSLFRYTAAGNSEEAKELANQFYGRWAK